MKTNLKIWVSLFVLITSMACAFVQNMIFPPQPVPESFTFTPIPTHLFDPMSDPAPITCTDDSCLRACLDRLEDVLQTRPFDSVGNPIYEEQDAEFNLVIYQVHGDQITDPAALYVPSEYHKYQEDTDSHMRVWEFYVAMIPSELRTLVNEFVIFTDARTQGDKEWV